MGDGYAAGGGRTQFPVTSVGGAVGDGRFAGVRRENKQEWQK